jgi:hypothetical protein
MSGKSAKKVDPMTRKTKKRRNGAGESLTVFFDKSDPQQLAALSMSQMLGSKHGLRKDVIVALLSALYERYEATGEVLTPIAVTNAIMEGFAISTPAKVFTLHPTASSPSAERVARELSEARSESGVVIVTAGGGKTTSQEVAKNFLNSMKGLASDFFG